MTDREINMFAAAAVEADYAAAHADAAAAVEADYAAARNTVLDAVPERK